MKPALAAGSGLVIVLINALSGVTGYAKQNRIDYKAGIQIGMGAIPGSLLVCGCSNFNHPNPQPSFGFLQLPLYH